MPIRWSAHIAADKAVGPVTVRQWQPGDVFYPLGAPGSKKLKDLFSDLKIPPPERRHVPVLLFGERIAWVCGLRLDERFKILPGSDCRAQGDSAARSAHLIL